MIVVNINVEPYDVYGGRAGHGQDGWLGNPYKLKSEADRSRILDLHKAYFRARIARDPEFKRRVLALKGRRVGCFCRPRACHLDVVAEYVNGQEEDKDAST